jgi:hypothetical protein
LARIAVDRHDFILTQCAWRAVPWSFQPSLVLDRKRQA